MMVAQIDWKYQATSVDDNTYSAFLHGVVLGDQIHASAFIENDAGLSSETYYLSFEGEELGRVIEDGAPVIYYDPITSDSAVVVTIGVDLDSDLLEMEWSTYNGDTIIGTNLIHVAEELESVKFGKLDNQNIYTLSYGSFTVDGFVSRLLWVDMINNAITIHDSLDALVLAIQPIPNTENYLSVTDFGIYVYDSNFTALEVDDLELEVAGIETVGDSLIIYGRNEAAAGTWVYYDDQLSPFDVQPVDGEDFYGYSFGDYHKCGDKSYLLGTVDTETNFLPSLVTYNSDYQIEQIIDLDLGGSDMFAYNGTCLDESLVLFGEVNDGEAANVLKLSSSGMVSTVGTQLAVSTVTVGSHDIAGQLHLSNDDSDVFTLQIYDSSGNNVSAASLPAGGSQIDVSKLPSGIYHAQVMAGNKWITTSRWMKQ